MNGFNDSGLWETQYRPKAVELLAKLDAETNPTKRDEIDGQIHALWNEYLNERARQTQAG